MERRTIHKAAPFLKLVNALCCFPTTVNRLPYNRLPRMPLMTSRGAINSYEKGVCFMARYR